MPLSAWDQIALEILKEYGANELIGKMYYKAGGNRWVPIQPTQVAELEWFRMFNTMGKELRSGTKFFSFEMEGSGHWSVLHFRNESDETGPYVAVALRYPDQ